MLPHDPTLSWTIEDLRALPSFTAVEESRIPRTTTMTATDYLAHLGTVSAYRVLRPVVREALLDDVRALLPDVVEVREDVTVQLARRT